MPLKSKRMLRVMIACEKQSSLLNTTTYTRVRGVRHIEAPTLADVVYTSIDSEHSRLCVIRTETKRYTDWIVFE